MKKGEKAQVTIFIIIAVIVLVIVGVFFFIKSPLSRDQLNVDNINNYVHSCVESVGNDAIEHVGLTGGYSELSEESSPGGVAYYFKDGENLMLSKEEMEKEIESYVDSMLFFCVRNFVDFPEYDVKQGEIKSAVKIESGRVVFDIEYPLKIERDGEVALVKDFGGEVDVRLGVIYDVVFEIMREQMLAPEYICGSCVGKLAEENDLLIDMWQYEDDVIFLIIDTNSEVNGGAICLSLRIGMKVRSKIFTILFMVVWVLGVVSAPYDSEEGYEKEEIEEDVKWLSFNGKIDVITDLSSEIDRVKRTVVVKSGGFIEVRGVRYEVDTDKKNKFFFDIDGGIAEGTEFVVGETGKYEIKGRVWNLPKGTKIVYGSEEVTFEVPNGGELPNVPEISDSDKASSDDVFYFKTKNPNEKFSLEGYDISGEMGFQDGGYFFTSRELEIEGANIHNSEGKRIFIDLKGKPGAYKGGYISFDKVKGKFVTGSNINERGPIVTFKADNPYGLVIGANDHFAIQALGNLAGNYVSIQNKYTGSSDSKVPYIEYLNSFLMNQDYQGITYDGKSDKARIRIPGGVIDEVGARKGTGMVAVSIKGYKSNDGKVKTSSVDGHAIGVSNLNEIGFGKNTRFIKIKSYADIVKNRKGTSSDDPYKYLYRGISDSHIANYMLTEEGFEKMTGIDIHPAGFTNEAIAGEIKRKYPNNYQQVGNIIYSYGGGEGETPYLINNQEGVRQLMDLYFSLPERYSRDKLPDAIHLFNDRYPGTGFTAVAYDDDNTIDMSTVKSGEDGFLNLGILRHELTHIADFKDRILHKAFHSSGIGANTISSDYAKRNYADPGEPPEYLERITEIVEEFAYDDEDWYNRDVKNLLRDPNKGKFYRAAFALFYYRKVLPGERVAQIYQRGGLRYTEKDLDSYLRAVNINPSSVKYK